MELNKIIESKGEVIHSFLRERDIMLSVMECDYLGKSIASTTLKQFIEAEIERKNRRLELVIKFPLTLAEEEDKGYKQALQHEIKHLQEIIKTIQ